VYHTNPQIHLLWRGLSRDNAWRGTHARASVATEVVASTHLAALLLPVPITILAGRIASLQRRAIPIIPILFAYRPSFELSSAHRCPKSDSTCRALGPPTLVQSILWPRALNKPAPVRPPPRQHRTRAGAIQIIAATVGRDGAPGLAVQPPGHVSCVLQPDRVPRAQAGLTVGVYNYVIAVLGVPPSR
jgi:hypothetical protein